MRRLSPKGIMDARNLQAAEQGFLVLWQHQKRQATSVRFVSRQYRAEISAMRPKTKDFVFIKLNLLGGVPYGHLLAGVHLVYALSSRAP